MLASFLIFGLLQPSALAAEPKSRTFDFTYSANIAGVGPSDTARIWLPVPSSSEEQRIDIIELELPGKGKLSSEPKYGNRILYCETTGAASGDILVRVQYRVTRKEVRADVNAPTQEEEQLFLKPDAKVPSEGKHLKLIDGKKLPADPLQLSRTLYDIVNGELRYSKEGTGWGQGDVNWVCDSKYGNCTDFHSLFIALARSQKMPGKFEIGFPLPEKRGKGVIAGYHCWAKIRPAGKGWLPVDISMANQNPKFKDYCFGNLSEDRLTFSVGRDVDLVPKQDGSALNFFIYPYVEVNKKVHPPEKITRSFSFEDVLEGKK